MNSAWNYLNPWCVLFLVIASGAWGCPGCADEPGEEEEAECVVAEDCAEGWDCLDGVCVEEETEYCLADEDCGDGFLCNELTGLCYEDETIEPPDPICESGLARCVDAGTLETCAADGLSWLESECQASTPACHLGSCHVCVPSLQWCEGDFAYECAADGTRRDEENCGIEGGSCEEGLCLICEAGELRCSADENALMECNSSGSGWHYNWCQHGCDSQLLLCKLPTDCTPGSAPVCQGDLVMSCGDEGEYQEQENCAAQNSVCQSGACVDRCAEAVAANSYIGCEYWPVVLSNTQLDVKFRGEFAVVLSNPHAGTTAQVSVYSHGEDLPTATAEVRGGEIEVIRLPWNALDARGELDPDTVQLYAQTQRGHTAYRLISTVPVTAYQFNPLTSHIPSGCTSNNDCTPVRPADDVCDTEIGACLLADYTYTNDASLLLPAHILGGGGSTYLVATMPHMERYFYWRHDLAEYGRIAMPSFVAIVATDPGTTTVTFRSRGATAAGGGLEAFVPGEQYTMELQQYEVVQLASGPFGTPTSGPATELGCTGPPLRHCVDSVMQEYGESDLTGSIIDSDKPVAVFSGADCRFVPFGEWACDHIEQQLFPFHNWGDSYVGAISATPPGGVTVGDHWRIVAAVDGTELTFTPAVHAGVTLAAGDWIGFETHQDFLVATQGITHPIMVSQFLVGQNAHGSEMGDPSMILSVPTAQYRSDFAFTTTETIANNYINVVRESGEPVVHNGHLLPSECWRPIIGTGYQVCSHLLPEGVHAHRVVSDGKLAVTVYGYDRYVSYGYPAGLDLQQTIIVNPGW